MVYDSGLRNRDICVREVVSIKKVVNVLEFGTAAPSCPWPPVLKSNSPDVVRYVLSHLEHSKRRKSRLVLLECLQ